ncbi:trypsin-like peptidase domain-containing protein [Bythopirellula polymerisocia]|uniref:Thioredoxin n=1 Tax=Bythopirellula polymerisocia TaxID=2528003 RepID=A0A5C6CTC6_9BACT|nr:trypsin-like peptidase domain-containing protein [Bythopirellula polymerisocia]TWU28193.1 Thioredoxin [Bythopirellula polymerisocia]
MVALKMCFSTASSIVLGILLSASACQAEIVLLDFSSATCGPCQQMRPTIQRLSAAGYPVRHVDIGRDPDTARQYGVDVVPTFIAVTDGREVARMTGPGSYEQLVEMLTTAEGSAAATSASLPDSARSNIAPQSAAATFANDTQRQTNQLGGSPTLTAQLLEATVKLSVEDADGMSAGTGTIVDAQGGAALVLTCGHIFRESEGKGPIKVTLFSATPTGAQVRETVAGQLMDFDLERDLALVIIRPGSPVQARRIAPPNTVFSPGAPVTTVGCNQGANPTVISSQITTVDRYQGAPNVEVAGAPIEGRSGGGLFNSAGQLIGVCFAADPQGNEGLYASLPSIQAKLKSMNLAMVFESPEKSPTASGPQVSLASATVQEPLAIRGQDAVAEVAPQAPIVSDRTMSIPQNLNPAEDAALAEIKRRGCDSEVICIIRPKDPTGKSEVITLGSMSPEFVESLVREQTATAGRSPATAAAGQLLK